MRTAERKALDIFEVEGQMRGPDYGQVERLECRVAELEKALANLIGFVAERERLTEHETYNENGILDW